LSPVELAVAIAISSFPLWAMDNNKSHNQVKELKNDYEKFLSLATRILNFVLVFLTILSVISLIIELGDFEISQQHRKILPSLTGLWFFIFVADTLRQMGD